MEPLYAMLALGIGLLLGSVLPAELIARRRGVDIRSVGDGNPGTWNAFRGLGKASGLVTAAYDLSVGVIAIQVATRLGVSDGVAYLAGIMTVVGHRFPVFKRFRGGGQGMAASAGLVIYGAAIALANGWLSATDFGLLAAVAVVTFGLTRSGGSVAIVMLPVFVTQVILARPDWQFAVFMVAVAGHIWIAQLVARRHGGASRTADPAHGRSQN